MKLVIVTLIVAMTLSGCMTGRRAGVQAPPIHTAGGMVEHYEKTRQDEVRCTRAESDGQMTKKGRTSKANPSCGNYWS